MFARVTQLEIDVMRTSVEDASARFAAEVMPALRSRAGFQGAVVLGDPGGAGNDRHALGARGRRRARRGVRADARPLRDPLPLAPGREVYEVVLRSSPGA